MENPLISIIIPTYNRVQLIGRAIDSVLAQTYIHWECIIVDDGSKDNTEKLIQNYLQKDPRIIFLKRYREPKGAPTCRNIGLEHAKGEFIVFLDSDDYLLSFCLHQRAQALKKHPNCNFLVFPMGVKKENGIVKQEISAQDDYLIPFLSADLPWSIMCPIWRRYYLLELNGFTEGYPRFNDPELMIRAMLMEGVRFKVLSDLDYDTVHIPRAKVDVSFKDIVYKSLLLFVPDTVKNLDKKGIPNYKHYLAYYLHLWFKYIYIPEGTREISQSMQLIRTFKKQGILSASKSVSLTVRLLVYSISGLLLKQPVNKLTDRGLYT